MTEAIRPLPIHVPDGDLQALLRRLRDTRWPDRETVDDWSQGVPIESAVELAAYWASNYDWRSAEQWLNSCGSSMTDIDGLAIHFLHIRSSHPTARPLLLTHGWPGAIFEFRDAVALLTDPVRHGGRAEDAFHLVIPSLPGYGFSGKPTRTGWNVRHIAKAWATLMDRLGYSGWIAQGGDWGAAVTTALGQLRPTGLAGIHVNMPLVMPDAPCPPFGADEQAMLDSLARYAQQEAGYSTQQTTRPQTLAYGLADSPVGLAAWIYEKFGAWSDCSGAPESVFSRDRMLDIITLYWLTNSGGSSARLYWESFANGFGAVQLDLPAGCSIYPAEIYRAPRSWAERCMNRLIYWGTPAQGGHFAAMEQPHLFAGELRGFNQALTAYLAGSLDKDA